MDQWELDTLQTIMDTDVKEVEKDQRVYLASHSYGNSRYHLLEKRFDGIQIEQIEVDKEWSKRVILCSDEVVQLIRVLLQWHFKEAASKSDASDEPIF